MKLEFSRQIFEKHSNIKFHENPSIGKQVAPCGQLGGRSARHTDRYKEANGRFPQFWNTPKYSQIIV